jgi:HlyD family type I secretion membrane fusion protein
MNIFERAIEKLEEQARHASDQGGTGPERAPGQGPGRVQLHAVGEPRRPGVAPTAEAAPAPEPPGGEPGRPEGEAVPPAAPGVTAASDASGAGDAEDRAEPEGQEGADAAPPTGEGSHALTETRPKEVEAARPEVEEATVLESLPAPPPPSFDLQQVQRSSRRHILFGLLLVLIGVGGFAAWASLARLASASIASGVVAPSSGKRAVQHLEGGIVKEVRIQEGQHVEAGQVLLVLDDTQPRASLQQTQSRYRALRARAARLAAEHNGLSEILFPEELTAVRDDPDVAATLAAQTDLFQARRQAYDSQVRILQDRIRQYDNQIVGYEAQRTAAEEQLRLIGEELEGARILYKKGVYEKPRLLAIERSAAGLKGSIGEYDAGIARAREAIGETRSRLLDLDTQRREETTKEYQEVQPSLLEQEERLRAVRDILDRIQVRAPASGTVMGLKYRTAGGVIPPRGEIAYVVADDDPLIIEVKIQPGDIDVVHPGLKAEVRFSAFNFRTTPVVDGELTQVSADLFTDNQGGRGFYSGRVEVSPEELHRAGELDLYPGMPAEVYIVTAIRTPLQYLLKPLTDSFSRAMRED